MTSSTAKRPSASVPVASASPPHLRLARSYASLAHLLIHDTIVLVILLALAFVVVSALWWAFWPHHRLPRNRVRHLALRAHLRLHPGPGHATAFELWLRWGRFACWRESKRTRPSLSGWHRFKHPKTHSLFLGWAHYFLRIRISVQEHLAVIGPPRSWKSALLSWLIMESPGPVVSTSSKPDIFALTSGVRVSRGPVWVFNPQGIGGIPSNVMWSPLDGCVNPATARRRAEAFALAVSMAGTEAAGSSPGKPPTRSPACLRPRPRPAGICGASAHGPGQSSSPRPSTSWLAPVMPNSLLSSPSSPVPPRRPQARSAW